MSRKNPYTRLLEEVEDFCFKLRTRHKKNMWLYPKKSLNIGWKLTDLYERAAAAKQLDYDVILEATDEGLEVSYIKKIPYIPW